MKILLLTDRMGTGGAETHIAQLALGLTEMGNAVSILSSGGVLADELEWQGIRQYRTLPMTRSPFRILSLRRYVRRLIKREHFDILHAHARIAALLIRGCEAYGAAPIVTAHAHFHSNPLLSRICFWGRYTVAVSEDLRAYLRSTYRVDAERIRVIPNGIDLKKFRPRQEERPQSRILFASRMDRDCSLGAELLCRLAPRLSAMHPDLTITVAGGGNDTDRIARLAEEVNQSVGKEIVSLVGWVQDMPSLLAKHDLFVGVSRAAIEASASGCAVILCGNEGYSGILTRESADDAMIGNFCARGCPAPTAERLESDLCRLLSDPDHKRQIAEEASAIVRQRLGSDRMCRETLTLYHRAVKSPPQRTLTVCGYFGCGNTGDDAILLGLTEALQSACPSLHLIALTKAPRRDRRRFGIECVGRKRPLAILGAALRSDALMFGGGSLLQNLTSTRSLSYYLGLICLAKHLRLRVCFCAAGIGPLIGKRQLLRTRDALNTCHYISLRAETSVRLLRSIGVDPAKLHVGADMAFLMPTPPPERAVFLAKEYDIPKEQHILCVVLHGGKETAHMRAVMLSALHILCQRHHLMPVFLIFDPSKDRAATLAASHALGGRVISLWEPSDAVSILSRADALIAMRLHALILSTVAGTPAIGIPTDSRDDKISAFADSVGQEVILPEELGVGNLVAKTEQLIASRDSLRPILSDSVTEMRKKARKDLANILEMIYNSNQ